MIKLNKKGTTLMELLISIALISVVLVFMIRLLVDINNSETNNDYAKDNQINRAEIIKMIETDLNNKEIVNIDDTGSNSNNLIIVFEFSDEAKSTITATTDSLVYENEEETRRWTMIDASIYINNVKVSYSADTKESGKKYYSLEIDIEIHTLNDNNKYGNNNRLDDIIITHIGDVTNYNGLKSGKTIDCLGYKC